MKPRREKKRSRAVGGAVEIAALLVFCAAIVGLNIYWIQENGRPPEGDDNSHLLHSITALDLLRGPAPTRDIMLWNQSYPPLLYVTTAFHYMAGGVSIRTALLSLLPWLVLFLVSLYLMGRQLGGPRLAWITLLIAGTSPAALHYSRHYFLDFPLAALTAAAMAAYVSTRGFERTLPSLLFGFFLGLSLLTKWSVALFVLPPLALLWLYHLIRAAKSGAAPAAGLLMAPLAATAAMMLRPFLDLSGAFDRHFGLFVSSWALVALLGFLVLAAIALKAGKSRGPELFKHLNFSLALWTIFALAGMWYLFASPMLRERADAQAAFNAPFSFHENALCNLPWTLQLYSFAAFFLCGGLVFALARKDRRGEVLFGLASLTVGFLLTSWAVPPDLRYLLPALSLMALAGLTWTAGSRVSAVLVLLAALPLAAYQAAGWVALYKGYRIPAPVAEGIPRQKISFQTLTLAPIIAQPGREDPVVHAVIDAFRLERLGDGPSVVAVMNDTDRCPVQMRTFQLYARLGGLPLQFVKLEGPRGRGDRPPRYFLEIFATAYGEPDWKESVKELIPGRLVLLRKIPAAGGVFTARLFAVR